MTTELEAVNTMLGSIGDPPINSLDESLSPDASRARSVLTETSRQVQSDGWWFNRSFLVTTPDNDGKITLPSNTLESQIYTAPAQGIVIRNNSLYDMVNQTDELPDGQYIVVLTLFQPFTEMPEKAKRFVTLKAARVFQSRFLSSQVLLPVQIADEQEAKAELMAEETRQTRVSMLDNIAARKVTARYGSYYRW